jgi:hypothetical protein
MWNGVFQSLCVQFLVFRSYVPFFPCSFLVPVCCLAVYRSMGVSHWNSQSPLFLVSLKYLQIFLGIYRYRYPTRYRWNIPWFTDDTPIGSRSHTHPSHSQTTLLLSSSLSTGIPLPYSTQCVSLCESLLDSQTLSLTLGVLVSHMGDPRGKCITESICWTTTYGDTILGTRRRRIIVPTESLCWVWCVKESR